MDRSRFFAIVDGACARAGGDVDRMAVALFDTLCELPADDVVAFQREYGRQHRRLYVRRLWCAGDHALGPMGEDAFADLRIHLVFRGRSAVDDVLTDPDALVDHLPDDLDDLRVAQELGAAAPDAFQQLTGVDLYERHPDLATVDLPDGDPVGAPLGLERRAELLPRLTRWCRGRTATRSLLSDVPWRGRA